MWKYQNTVFQPELYPNKRYIGKKILYKRVAKPPLKGKKKRRISKVDSDWQLYYGSSPTVNAVIAEHGTDRFSREVLHLCQTKTEMSYLETKEIFDRGALLSDQYYNDWVTCRITRKQLQSVRQRLQ
jgi:Putative endonuclease segE, GIY-YIG domain